MSEEERDTFEVDSILEKKVEDGKELFLVHWKGYAHSEDTWEPLANLSEAQEALEAFEINARVRRRLRKRSEPCFYSDRDPLPPKPRRAKRPREEEDLEVVEVRSRAGELVWLVETQGRHIYTTLAQLKRRAPGTLIDFLVGKLRFSPAGCNHILA